MKDHLQLDRRDFVRLTLAGAAGAVTACNSPARKTLPLLLSDDPLPEGVASWSRGVCRACEAGCGVLVKRMDAAVPVESDGQPALQHWLVAKKLEGNPDHPVNRGGLCARGQAALEVLYHPRRLNHVLRVHGRRGEGQFDEINWESALQQMRHHLSDAGTGQILWIGQPLRGAEGEALDQLLRAVGGRRLWHRPLTVAGAGEEAAALARLPEADLLLSFGNFLESAAGQVPAMRAFSQFRRNPHRALFLQLEPRLSLTAASADRWLALRPGSEGLVAQALAAAILSQRKQPLPAGWQTVSLPQAAAASGLLLAQLQFLLDHLAQARRPVVIGGDALAGYGDRGYARAAVAALAAALGQAPPLAVPPQEPLLAATAKLPDPPRILFLDHVDPQTTLPSSMEWDAWLRQVPLVVALQTLPSPSSLQADLVLPLSTPLESWTDDATTALDGTPVFTLNPPAMRRLHDTRSRLEILAALTAAPGAPVPLPEDQLRLRWLKLNKQWAPRTPADEFWQSAVQRGGFWPEPVPRAASNPRPALPALPAVPPPTPLPPLRTGAFYLRLYASPLFGDASPCLSWLQETPDPTGSVMWGSWVELHPQVAARFGLSNGDGVWLESGAGKLELPVLIFPGLHPETVAVPALYAMRESTPLWDQTPFRLLAPEGGQDTPAWLSTQVRLRPSGRRLPLARFGHSLIQEIKHR